MISGSKHGTSKCTWRIISLEENTYMHFAHLTSCMEPLKRASNLTRTSQWWHSVIWVTRVMCCQIHSPNEIRWIRFAKELRHESTHLLFQLILKIFDDFLSHQLACELKTSTSKKTRTNYKYSRSSHRQIYWLLHKGKTDQVDTSIKDVFRKASTGFPGITRTGLEGPCLPHSKHNALRTSPKYNNGQRS